MKTEEYSITSLNPDGQIEILTETSDDSIPLDIVTEDGEYINPLL